MAKTPKTDLEATKRLMAALGRMPPKQHKDMKLGKPQTKKLSARSKRGIKRQSSA